MQLIVERCCGLDVHRDVVLDEFRDWQNRPLDPLYRVIFFDALRLKIRDDASGGFASTATAHTTIVPPSMTRVWPVM